MEKWEYDECTKTVCYKRRKEMSMIHLPDLVLGDPEYDLIRDETPCRRDPGTVPNKIEYAKGAKGNDTMTVGDWLKAPLGNPIPKKGINPKDAIGVKKVPMGYIPLAAQAYFSLGMEYEPQCVVDNHVKRTPVVMPPLTTLYTSLGMWNGAFKYQPYNWRQGGKVSVSIYVDAVVRHINYWKAREEIATDSKVPHLGHAMAGISILIDAWEGGCTTDDRPLHQFDPAIMRAISLPPWEPTIDIRACDMADYALWLLSLWMSSGIDYLSNSSVPVLGRVMAAISVIIENQKMSQFIDDRQDGNFISEMEQWVSKSTELLTIWGMSKPK